MITIDTKTKAVSNHREHDPQMYNQFGNCTPGYVRGWIKPNYPVPALYRCTDYSGYIPFPMNYWNDQDIANEDSYWLKSYNQ